MSPHCHNKEEEGHEVSILSPPTPGDGSLSQEKYIELQTRQYMRQYMKIRAPILLGIPQSSTAGDEIESIEDLSYAFCHLPEDVRTKKMEKAIAMFDAERKHYESMLSRQLNAELAVSKLNELHREIQRDREDREREKREERTENAKSIILEYYEDMAERETRMALNTLFVVLVCFGAAYLYLLFKYAGFTGIYDPELCSGWHGSNGLIMRWMPFGSEFMSVMCKLRRVGHVVASLACLVFLGSFMVLFGTRVGIVISMYTTIAVSYFLFENMAINYARVAGPKIAGILAMGSLTFWLIVNRIGDVQSECLQEISRSDGSRQHLAKIMDNYGICIVNGHPQKTKVVLGVAPFVVAVAVSFHVIWNDTI